MNGKSHIFRSHRFMQSSGRVTSWLPGRPAERRFWSNTLKIAGVDSKFGGIIQGTMKQMGQNIRCQKYMGNSCRGSPTGIYLGTLAFNIFINDMFYFMEQYSLYNYTDDNSLSTPAPLVDNALSNLKHDCVISIRWFKTMVWKQKPIYFSFT